MMLTRLSRGLAWGVVAAVLAACHDTGGTPTVQGPLAGVRYVNVVPDTGALDIRIIDIVGDAPATFGASFRTGGSPIGGAAQTSPPYQAVAAGRRHIRVFNSSSDPVIAQQVHVDTTFTFEANRNYTFALRGFSRAGQAPHVVAAIQPDAPPASSAGQIAVRVWQLAPGLDPAATTPLDAWIVVRGSAALAGAPTIAGLSYTDTSRYVGIATGTYRVAFTAAGTTQPVLFEANLPTGGAGIGGTTAAGSALTVVVVPRSVPGSRAPMAFTAIQPVALTSNPDSTVTAVAVAPHGLATGAGVVVSGADTAIYNGTFTVTVVDATTFRYRTTRTTAGSPATGYPFFLPGGSASSFNGLPISRLTASGTTATLATSASHGLAKNDIITVSGANQAEYNGIFAVDSVVSGTRVTYTMSGTPTTPATGAPVWRRGVDDFTRPFTMFLIDRRP
jgi:Domain of unknown function (DUF4397)